MFARGFDKEIRTLETIQDLDYGLGIQTKVCTILRSDKNVHRLFFFPANLFPSHEIKSEIVLNFQSI